MSAQVLTSQFIGPPIAGLLFAASAAWLFAGDAFSFLLAAGRNSTTPGTSSRSHASPQLDHQPAQEGTNQ
jgi:hypothetical protein